MLEKFGAVIISTITFLVYSFYLSPTELGLATIALSVALIISQTVTTLFQDPIVCKDRLSKKDISSCFIFNVSLSIILYILIVGLTYLFSVDKQLFSLIAVAAIVVPISSIASIYSGVLRRLRRFKILAIRTLVCRILGAIVGVSLVYYWQGGPLAMIAQVIVIELFGLFGMMLSIKLKFKPTFHFFTVKNFLKQGVAIALRKLSWEACIKGAPLAIAAVASPALVGAFAFAWRLVDMPRTAIQSGAMSFILPVFVGVNKNKADLKDAYIKANKLTMIMLCPLFVGLAICAEPMVQIMFGNKWDEAIPLLQFFAILTVINSTRLYAPTLFTSLGIPSIGLKTDFFSTVVTLGVILMLVAPYGIIAIALAFLIRTFINYPISLIKINAAVGLSISQQLLMYKMQLVCCLFMTVAMLFARYFVEVSQIQLLTVQVFVGFFVYLFFTIILEKKYVVMLLNRNIN